MRFHFRQVVVSAALMAATGSLLAPGPAHAQVGSNQTMQDSCTSFAQSILQQAYQASPWAASVFEQQAAPELLQVLQGRSLQSILAPDSGELGQLVGVQVPTVTVTPNDTSQGGLTSCTYEATGNFQNGTATMKLEVVYRNNQWQVMNVGLHDVKQS